MSAPKLWTAEQEVALLDYIDKTLLPNTKGNRTRREQKCVAIAKHLNKKARPSNGHRRLDWKAIYSQCRFMVSKRSRYNPPSVDDLFAEGRAYLIAEKPGACLTVPKTTQPDLNREQGGNKSETTPERYGLRQRQQRQHRQARESQVEREQIPMKSETNGFMINQRWTRHMRDQFRIDKPQLQMRLGSLNDSILETAVQLQHYLPGINLDALASSCDIQGPVGSISLHAIKSGADMVKVYRVILGRVISEWVLNDSFPAFDLTAGEPGELIKGILEEKDAMQLQAVVSALLKDLSHDMTSTASFRNKILPKRTKSLAWRLVRSLQASDLQASGYPEAQVALSSTQCDGKWSALKTLLKGLFGEALNFCIELRQWQKPAEVSWPAESEGFDCNSMEAENVSDQRQSSLTVAFTISPMLIGEAGAVLAKAVVQVTKKMEGYATPGS